MLTAIRERFEFIAEHRTRQGEAPPDLASVPAEEEGVYSMLGRAINDFTRSVS